MSFNRALKFALSFALMDQAERIKLAGDTSIKIDRLMERLDSALDQNGRLIGDNKKLRQELQEMLRLFQSIAAEIRAAPHGSSCARPSTGQCDCWKLSVVKLMLAYGDKPA